MYEKQVLDYQNGYWSWLVVLDDDRYINFLNSHNHGQLINREAATRFDTRSQD